MFESRREYLKTICKATAAPLLLVCILNASPARAQWLWWSYNTTPCANGQCSQNVRKTTEEKPRAADDGAVEVNESKSEENPAPPPEPLEAATCCGIFCGKDAAKYDKALRDACARYGDSYEEACKRQGSEKIQVGEITAASYAGATYGYDGHVERVLICPGNCGGRVDEVISHEVGGHVRQFLLYPRMSLGLHEGGAQLTEQQQVNPGYLRRAARYGSDANFVDVVYWEEYRSNQSTYTFSYATIRTLYELGGSRWLAAMLKEACETDFEKALMRWYGISENYLNKLVHKYIEADGSAKSLKSVIKEQKR